MSRLTKSLKRLIDRCVKDSIDSKLVQWAREYGYGKPDDLGYAHVNALQRLHDHAGWLPPPEPVRAPTKTEADRTNQAFLDFERENWKMAQVVRNRYFRPNDYMPCRLVALKKIGIDISADTYARWLDHGRSEISVLLIKKKKT